LYISLVKTSVHPTTVEVVKYTISLSKNLYLVVIGFLVISLKPNFFNYNSTQIKTVVTKKTQDKVMRLTEVND